MRRDVCLIVMGLVGMLAPHSFRTDLTAGEALQVAVTLAGLAFLVVAVAGIADRERR